MEYKEIREGAGLKAKPIVEAIKTAYPAYSKSIHSMVEHPNKYGIRLLNKADNIFEQICNGALEARKPDKRTKPCRLSFRMTKKQLRQFNLWKTASGYETNQDALTYIVGEWLKGVNHGNDK